MTGNGLVQLTAKDFKSDQEVRWCPGCGDYAILAGVQSFLPELGIPRENLVFVSGIGCAARFPYYLETYGMHSIHGRAPAIATGLATSRPDLSVWVVTGDGDALSIGGNHLIHALRRNVNITILLFNNRIYGLTKGQYSPTSERGKVTKSTPLGSVDQPFNPLSIAIGAEATFVARAIDTDKQGSLEVLRAAAAHRGAAFVEVLQNCNIYNDGAFDVVRNEKENRLYLRAGEEVRWGDRGVRMRPDGTLEIVDASVGGLLRHDPGRDDPGLAFALARLTWETAGVVPLGVFRAVEPARRTRTSCTSRCAPPSSARARESSRLCSTAPTPGRSELGLVRQAGFGRSRILRLDPRLRRGRSRRRRLRRRTDLFAIEEVEPGVWLSQTPAPRCENALRFARASSHLLHGAGGRARAGRLRALGRDRARRAADAAGCAECRGGRTAPRPACRVTRRARPLLRGGQGEPGAVDSRLRAGPRALCRLHLAPPTGGTRDPASRRRQQPSVAPAPASRPVSDRLGDPGGRRRARDDGAPDGRAVRHRPDPRPGRQADAGRNLDRGVCPGAAVPWGRAAARRAQPRPRGRHRRARSPRSERATRRRSARTTPSSIRDAPASSWSVRCARGRSCSTGPSGARSRRSATNEFSSREATLEDPGDPTIPRLEAADGPLWLLSVDQL